MDKVQIYTLALIVLKISINAIYDGREHNFKSGIKNVLVYSIAMAPLWGRIFGAW